MLAHVHLQRVGKRRRAQEPRRAQPRQQVVGAGLGGQQRAARQRQHAAAERGVTELGLVAHRDGDAERAEDRLDQWRVLARAADHDGDLVRCCPLVDQPLDVRTDELDLSPRAATAQQAHGAGGLDAAVRGEEMALDVRQRGGIVVLRARR